MDNTYILKPITPSLDAYYYDSVLPLIKKLGLSDKLSAYSILLYLELVRITYAAIKNKQLDENQLPYIEYSLDQVQALLSCCKNTAIKAMNALSTEKGVGLILKRRRGQGKSNIYYVRAIEISDSSNYIDTKDHNANNQSVKPCPEKWKKPTTKTPFFALQEVHNPDSQYNTTDININNTNNHIISSDKDVDAIIDTIHRQIDYTSLSITHPDKLSTIDTLVDIMVEIALCPNNSTKPLVNGIPLSFIRRRMSQIAYNHIVYILDCLAQNKSQIKNIKNYLIATLHNSVVTMDAYYQAQINHAYPSLSNPRKYTINNEYTDLT